MINWKERIKAAGIHFSCGLVVACLAAAVVLWLWYPYPYRELSGGRELFLILITVDVILGPMTTLAIFDMRKGWPVMRRDLIVVVLLQAAALSYGMWTVAVARPVQLVFELNGFRVVHALDIPDELVDKAPPGLNVYPWTGPGLLSVRPLTDPSESLQVTLAAATGGPQLAERPDLWQPYEAAKSQLLARGKPVQQLRSRFPEIGSELDALLARAGRQPADALYIPVISRKGIWTTVIDAHTANVIGFLPVDSF
jgi:hypothetical protein